MNNQDLTGRQGKNMTTLRKMGAASIAGAALTVLASASTQAATAQDQADNGHTVHRISHTLAQ